MQTLKKNLKGVRKVIGKLIAIEGIDGSGKSTLIKHLEEELRNDGHPITTVATREVENEPVFEAVINGYSLDPLSPAYMFFFQLLHTHKADRARRALSEGGIVLADRWDLSFFVWHENFGFFSKKSAELRDGVSHLAFDGIKPHLGIYLDVSVDKALDRRMWRGEMIVDLEAERNFYTTVVSAYKSLTERHGWTVVDANDGFEQVSEEVLRLIRGALKK